MGRRYIAWPEAYREFFVPDGALRDIIVRDATVDDWRSLVEYLLAFGHDFKIEIGENEHAVPEDVVAFLQAHVGDVAGTPHCDFDLAGLAVVCWFYEDETIEMDIEPGEVTDRVRYTALLEFMQVVSDLVGKPVTLTPEGEEDRPLIRCSPRAATQFFPENGSSSNPTLWTYRRR